METKTCKKCDETFPQNADYFGHTPTGNFRNTCRYCHNKKNKEWHADNPFARQERGEQRMLREREAGGRGYTAEDIFKIRKQLGNKCAYCSTPLNHGGHVDHIVPVSRGGKNEPENLTLACARCNLEKHAKTPEEFLAWQIKCGIVDR